MGQKNIRLVQTTKNILQCKKMDCKRHATHTQCKIIRLLLLVQQMRMLHKAEQGIERECNKKCTVRSDHHLAGVVFGFVH